MSRSRTIKGPNLTKWTINDEGPDVGIQITRSEYASDGHATLRWRNRESVVIDHAVLPQVIEALSKLT